MSNTYKKAKEDFEYLVKHHGNKPYDLTGGYVDGDWYEELLGNPTKQNAMNHYIQLIGYSASSGFESDDYRAHSPDLSDKRVVSIYKKYGFEVRGNFKDSEIYG